ncbi:MAG: sulfite exporter TauE/SafE family protein [Verrucomicrobia bacterium]|nr:sulfite exporter TauE/SafE family protein [Verrucomicrobiota bacterium]
MQPISFVEAPILLTAGFLAGIMNAVAGGGTFLTFPALVFIGLPSVVANQTSTIAVFPGQVASFWAYRRILAAEKRTVLVLGVTSLFGGCLGALVLLRTSSAAFDRLVPWLLLFATLLFAYGKTLREHLGWRLVEASGGEIGWTPLLKAAALQFVIGLYGGFYGAGAGILELAVLDLLGLENIHLANALKVILTTAFNVLALVIFITVGKVFWPQGLLMGLATIGGGYGGAWVAQRLPQAWVRRFVTAVGALMTAYFFARLY